VLSVDGSAYLAGTISNIIKNHVPRDAKGNNDLLRSGVMWQYLNYAMSDSEGIARFTKQDAQHNAGFEGGSISTVESPSTEEVNMTTVDLLLASHGWTAGVDLLKIDTEGNDNKVALHFHI
jgi:FkbM family methyltransferase